MGHLLVPLMDLMILNCHLASHLDLVTMDQHLGLVNLDQRHLAHHLDLLIMDRHLALVIMDQQNLAFHLNLVKMDHSLAPLLDPHLGFGLALVIRIRHPERKQTFDQLGHRCVQLK